MTRRERDAVLRNRRPTKQTRLDKYIDASGNDYSHLADTEGFKEAWANYQVALKDGKQQIERREKDRDTTS